MTSEDEYLQHMQSTSAPEKPFVSAWEALKPSSDERLDIDFSRIRGKLRETDLG